VVSTPGRVANRTRRRKLARARSARHAGRLHSVSTATAPTFETPRSGRSGAARVAAVVLAGFLAVVSLGLFVGAGVLLWADGQKDAQGYIATASEPFRTSSPALVTDDLDVDLDGAGWLLGPDNYGKVRLQVTPHGDKPVFVGIAPTRDVRNYLGGTAHSTLRDIDYSPFEAQYRNHGGAERATPPARESFWNASATGAGRQTLTWDVEDGNWSVVVMNADGTRGVDAGVRAGAKVPELGTAGWIALGGALVLLVAAVGVVVLAVRPRD
jgi:hypothetical protein